MTCKAWTYLLSEWRFGRLAEYTDQAPHQRESRMGGLRLLPDLDDCLERGALQVCARVVAEGAPAQGGGYPGPWYTSCELSLSRFVDTGRESFNRQARFGHLRLLVHIGHQPDASPSG